MINLKSSLIAPSLALLLCTNIYASESYTVTDMSLKDALQKISKESNLSYFADESLIKGKKSQNIKNVEGIDQALQAILKGTGLEAIIEDNTIVIKKKKLNSNSSSLGDVDVVASGNETEGSGSYTIDSMSTATKLNMSIKDTPQTIVVVTNQELQDKNIQNFRNLSDSVVGIHSLVFGSDNLDITTRGFGIDYYQLDGIPSEYDYTATEQNLILFDRVEIVKGASGLTTGAGNPAASINMVRKHANSEEFEGKLILEAGSWNTKSATVDLSIPLNEDGSIRSRIIAQKKSEESFKDFYKRDADTFYGVVDIDISDQTKVSVGASSSKSESKGSTNVGTPIFFSDGSFTNFDASDSFVPKWASLDKKTTSMFANFEHVFFNDIKINANYSYHKTKYTENKTFYNGYPDKTTGLGLATLWGAWFYEYQTTSKVLDLYSSIPFDLGGQNHEYIIGVTHNDTKKPGGYAYDYDTVLGQSVYNWDGNSTEPKYGLLKKNNISTKQSALYTVGKFELRDKLKLIVGARLSNYKVDSLGYGNPASYKINNTLTPYAGLVYDINQNHSTYISYSNIFKAQQKRDISGDVLDPKEGHNYEAGIKGEYFNKRLNTSITYFEIRQDNVAEDSGEYIPGTTESAYKLISGVKSKGIEIMAKGEVSDNWNVDFGLSSFSVKDADGEKIKTLTPKNEILLSTKYNFGKLSIGGGVTWKDKFYTDVRNPSNKKIKIIQDAFYLANAMVKYEFPQELSLQLNISNLFDKEYYSNINKYTGSYVFEDARKTTLTLSYKF